MSSENPWSSRTNGAVILWLVLIPKNNKYTKTFNYNYPSNGQIRKRLLNNVNYERYKLFTKYYTLGENIKNVN